MQFSDMKLRAESIGGEIKQADADVKEATLMRERAEAALDTARDYETKAIARAADKRKERTELAQMMHDHILGQGEASVIAGRIELKNSIFEMPMADQSYIHKPADIPGDIPGDNADSVPITEGMQP